MRKAYDPYSYWNQLVSGKYDLATVGHPELGAYNRIAYRLRLSAFIKSIANLPQWPCVRVFEAAFGVGFYLKFCADAGITQLSGVDLSLAAVARAKNLFPEYHLFQCDITTALSIQPGSADLVTAIDVLYHIVDDQKWEQALGQLCDLVSAGGVFVCTDKFPTTQIYQRDPHVRRRPVEMYADVIRKHGLVIKKIQPVFVFMDDPIPDGRPHWLACLSYLQWRVVNKAIRIFGPWQHVRNGVALFLAGVQFPFEKIALSLLNRSPNLEMMVAQRSNRKAE